MRDEHTIEDGGTAEVDRAVHDTTDPTDAAENDSTAKQERRNEKLPENYSEAQYFWREFQQQFIGEES